MTVHQLRREIGESAVINSEIEAASCEFQLKLGNRIEKDRLWKDRLSKYSNEGFGAEI